MIDLLILMGICAVICMFIGMPLLGIILGALVWAIIG